MISIGIKLRRPRSLTVALLAFVLAVVYLCGGSKGILKSNYGEPAEREALIKACGYEVTDCESSIVTVPSEFGEVYEEYNRLQRQQGFDLSLFKGREVTKYTYTVKEHPSGDTVLINLLVCDGALIGADVMSTAIDGFIKPLK